MAETQTTSFKAPAKPKKNGHVPSEEEKAQTAIDSNAPTLNPAPARSTWTKPILFAGGAILLLIGVLVGVRYWHFSSTHVATDDATLASDVTQVSPQVSGTVSKVLVRDNQLVKAGELL